MTSSSGTTNGNSTSSTGSSGSSGSCTLSSECYPSTGSTGNAMYCFSQQMISHPLGAIEGDGGLTACECKEACPYPGFGIRSSVAFCSLVDGGVPLKDGGVGWDVDCTYFEPPTGRRPEGLAKAQTMRASPVGSWFAKVSHLEAASVGAFRRMAHELGEMGAPRSLVIRARAAAREEIHHARLTRRLAVRHGAAPPRVQVATWRSRSLEEMAFENAREGVVGETFGAALAVWQSRHASDAEVREMAAEISEDEVGHAELSFAIHRWAMSKLGGSARQRINDAIRDAAAALGEAAGGVPPEVGMPTAPERAQLLRDLAGEFWS